MNFGGLAQVSFRTPMALDHLCDEKRSCWLIFQTIPQCSDLIDDFVGQHFGWNSVGLSFS